MNSIQRSALALLALLFFTGKSYAPPPGEHDGYIWTDRADAYAEAFCNGVNSAYGSYTQDCAHFASQIGQAGCIGLAETNSNNWGNYWIAPLRDCWAYYNDEPDNNWENICTSAEYGDEPCHTTSHPWFPDCYDDNSEFWPPIYHTTVTRTEALANWFMCADTDWPSSAICDYLSEVPDWAGPGCFAFRVRYNILSGYSWHAVYLGIDYFGRLSYYAHTSNRCCDNDYPLSALFDEDGFEWLEIYAGLSFSEHKGVSR